MKRTSRYALFGVVVALGTAAIVWAHCDTMGGPVVLTGQKALQSGDLTPVLKWVAPAQEQELRSTFEHVQAARKQGGAAAELADRYFLETLVRLHRAGEGQPFSGLKPAGEGITPTLAAADQALDDGNVDAVVKSLSEQVAQGVRQRFERARTARRGADESTAAGREFVAAYIEFVHYVERIEQDASGAAAHAEASAAPHEH